MKELVVTEETEMEHPNVISIALHDSSFMISFPSAEDKNLWVQALHSATCQVRIVFVPTLKYVKFAVEICHYSL